MFDRLTSARRSLRQFNDEVDIDALNPAEAKRVVEEYAAIEKAAACGRLRALRHLENDQSTVDWLAKETGQSKGDAARDVDAAKKVRSATDDALREGELSADQAREVASAADADPGAEASLLDSARNESFAELKRKAKQTRAAATDDAEKERRAHAERTVEFGTDEETGKGTMNVSGPAAKVAQMKAWLRPFVEAQFDKARKEGRHGTIGSYAFDALYAALGLAADRRIGLDDTAPPAGPPAKVLVRVDATALRRGHTVAGETCEIDGLGPVPVAALRELLADAAIYLIVTDGRDVWNVTNLARGSNAHQQVVLDWLHVGCSRQGCAATGNLQVDHRIDWATVHVTELANLDWLCPADHRRKTHEGWSLVKGRGRRRMVPPDHPANSPPASRVA